MSIAPKTNLKSQGKNMHDHKPKQDKHSRQEGKEIKREGRKKKANKARGT